MINETVISSKAKILVLALAFSFVCCDKKNIHVCKVDTHKEGWGISGTSPNFKPFLSWVSDTTEFINVISKKRDLPSVELRLSESRIDSMPSDLGDDLFSRTIIFKKAKCGI